jgi:hypothetical protein
VWPHEVNPEGKQICCSTLLEYFRYLNGTKVYTLTHWIVNSLAPGLKLFWTTNTIAELIDWDPALTYTEILTVLLKLDPSINSRSRRWLKLLLPPQVKLVQILASSVGAGAVWVRINTAACQLIGTMFQVGTVDENIQQYERCSYTTCWKTNVSVIKLMNSACLIY